MAENKYIEVGGRLHSIATGNIIAGADEIIDDNKGKKQSVINAETDAALADRYSKDETYNKTQLDSMITTPNIEYKNYDTYADMLAETNHPAGAIYRVANYDGEEEEVAAKYTEYSWDGEQYKVMAVRNYGIDNEPVAGSDNLVKSGGAFTQSSQLESEIKNINYVLGNQLQVNFTKLDYTGMMFNGTNIVQSNVTYDSIMIPVEIGIEYSFQSTTGINSIRFSNTPFEIGGSIGISITISNSISVENGYLLVTFNKNSIADVIILVKNKISNLTKTVENLEKRVFKLDGTYTDLEYVRGGRLTKGIQIPFRGKCKVTITVKDGTDTGGFYIYHYTEGAIGSAYFSTSKNFGEYAEITIPDEDDGVWLFTTDLSLSEPRTYEVIFKNIENSLAEDVQELNEDVQKLLPLINENIAVAKNRRLTQPVYLGHTGEKCMVSIDLVSGTDTDGWALYGTNADGTAIDTTNVLVNIRTPFGEVKEITIPSNGYVWLFTANNTASEARTFNFNANLSSSLQGQIYKIENEIDIITEKALPLTGKTIVCFGDSITEFGTPPYSEYLAEMTGATIINVGIGGTQLRQRTTPSTTPSGSTQCYAGLDIVNMVKAACTQDFTIVRASASELARISTDDNTAIVERLAAIDWTKVDYITIFAGTNDWANNGGNTGDKTTTDISYTCGAINDIVERICSTYKKVQLYWFTPIIRCVNAPAFSDTESYLIGDMCSYQDGFYRFIVAHQGTWDANDVESITRVDFRIPEYYSDNWQNNGKTLREFSALIEEVVLNNHIPIFDLYNRLGWNLYNFSEYFVDSDNTHPYKGFKQIAEKIKKFILSD